VSVHGIDGAAGCGKTTRLIQLLVEKVEQHPLQAGQKILALTFMHGSRRRLEERLSSVPIIRGRFACETIDSFAWQLRRRWRGLAQHLALPMPDELDFDGQCEVAASLLERSDVCSWIVKSFPIVLVDEAQDLRPQRLRMIQALRLSATLIIAADEFQCLDTSLRPNPLANWLPTVCEVEHLNVARRTDVVGLLSAASAIRDGGVPATLGAFRVHATPSIPMAAAYLANAIAWGGNGSVAVITPSLQGGFSRGVVARVCAVPCGQQQNGPYPIRWERSEHDEAAELEQALMLPDVCTLAEGVQALNALPICGPVNQTKRWLDYQNRAFGKRQFARQEIVANLKRHITLRRNRGLHESGRLLAMTVQQAKNREFDIVVVIWPFEVGGDAEHKRRLLYNAVTRARRSCTVLVRGAQLPNAAPFA
jgi:hypothetical protein